MYPSGWCHRKFFAPRKSANPAKQPRRDEDIIQEVIKEQQRKDEDKQLAEQKETDELGQEVAAAVSDTTKSTA